MERHINALGVNLIKTFEGLRLEAYPDPGTKGAPWTIGYGHTGPDVMPGLRITEDKAVELLVKDIIHFEDGVFDLVKMPITDNQFSALVCISYNIGLTNLANSLLLKFLNNGFYQKTADEFLRWNKSGGNILPGLTNRRIEERRLFLLG